MKLHTFSFAVLALLGFSSCTLMGRSASPGSQEPVRAVTTEPGVVPAGTPLLVRTSEAVRTDKAFRTTVYDASVAEEILDQDGNILIPKMSPVELVVRRVSFLGPGGSGMSELILGVQAVTVNDVRYPVESGDGTGKGAGLEPQGAVAVAGGASTGRLLTAGRRINVPAKTVLIFRTEDPIRLKGYRQ